MRGEGYRRNREGGFTLVEVLMSVAIMGIATVSIFLLMGSMDRQSTNIKHQTFATQKAIQMMEELRALVGRTGSIGILDNYDDGASYNNVLTTEDVGSNPANPLSGNITMGSDWRYIRQISIIKIPTDSYMRRVYVRVYLADESNPTQPKVQLAQSVSIIKTSVAGGVPIQVYDVYVLALENVPGWWVAMSSIKPMMDDLVSDFQTRNPGFEMRTHWITRSSYGRDPYYTPYINDAVRADLLSDIPGVYYYPGLIKFTKSGVDYDDDYYVPEIFKSRMNIDGTMTNTSSYALSDQFNQAVRYPEEERLYNEAVSQAWAAGDALPEMSLRMLLEKMNYSPGELGNIMIINLHGELLPIPSMRNYSDAARDPAGNPDARVVTHPQQLKYDPSPNSAVLRVYPYVMDPDSWAHDSTLSNITICFPGKDFTGAGIISVEKCEGNAVADYAWSTATLTNSYTLSLTADGTTVLTLFDSPLRHAQNGGNKGLPSGNRLYGLEYIPCAVHPGVTPDFTYDLTLNNPVKPKNTARWSIQINGSALSDGIYTVDTRLGSTTSDAYPNFSRTYFWVGTTPPVTEQYQFVGDPRHCPYLDVKRDNRYNWYFCAVPTGDYQGFTKTVDGWSGDKLNMDVPRFFQLYRKGLLYTNGIWTAITGFSNYYLGIGGEFGGDSANDLPSSVPVIEKLWVTSGSTTVRGINEITNSPGNHTYSRIISSTDHSWYARYWIGELFPDTQWAYWQANGNLPSGSGNFYRASYTTLSLPFNPLKRTGTKGCSSFINGGTTGNHFRHDWPWGQQGLITGAGNYLAELFNYPLVTPLDASRPFQLNYNGDVPPEWNDPEYSGQRVTHSFGHVFYDYGSTSDEASAGVNLVWGGMAFYMMINGIDKQPDFGPGQISRLALMGVFSQFLDNGRLTGRPITEGRIPQLPLLTVHTPINGEEFMNPSTISCTWTIQWKRWDGEKYTPQYPGGFAETTPMAYSVKYSSDNGRTWQFVQDGAYTIAGEKDYPAHTQTVTLYDWDVSSLSKGTYLIRVEGYRQDIELHYAYQLVRIYIWR